MWDKEISKSEHHFSLKKFQHWISKRKNDDRLPDDLYMSPVAVPAANVFSSSSAPRDFDKITPNALYMRAEKIILLF